MEAEERGDVNLPQASYSILSVDLGISTGVAYYDPRINSLAYETIRDPLCLFPLITLLNPNIVLLERFPSTRKSLTTEVEIAYTQLSRTATMISPGDWKPFMRNKEEKFPYIETQHEKDAINILRYYLLTRDLGDIECT